MALNKAFSVAKICRVIKNNSVETAYKVKIAGLRFPRGQRDYYFPADRSRITAIEMGLNDYSNYLKEKYQDE